MRMQKGLANFLILSFLLFSACADRLEGNFRTLPDKGQFSYLEEIVPPCVPTESEPTPCSMGLPESVDMVSSLGSIRIWNHVPSFDYLLFSGDDDLLGRKHIVVRGIIQSDTTRCEKYPVVAHNYVYISFPLDGMYYYYCFVDIMVKEYIVGEGPPKLTVIMHRENVYEEELDSTGKVRPEIIQFLKDPQSRTAEAYEGKEMVLFLGATITTSIESWDSTGVFSIWLVQQSDNGFRAVSQFRYVIPSLSSQLNLPLDEMTEDIKRAAKKRVALTGGRIGIDTALPMLVTDANRLREFYTTVGAVYEGDNATVLPPPAPGEDDPPPPTLPVNDGTVSPTTPVPGGEPAVPSSTDDAGTTTSTLTVPTTTTAVEDTSTSTTTVEDAEPTTTRSAVVPAAAEEEPVFQPADDAVASTTTTEATTTTLAEPTTTTVAEVPESPTTTVGSGEEGEQVATSIVPVEDEATPPAADDGNQGDGQPAQPV